MDYDPHLEEVAGTFVTPFYGEMLHGNILRRSASERSEFAVELRATAKRLDEETAERFLDFPEWRGRMSIAWMVGLRGWHSLVPKIGRLLLQSEFVYAGQGFAVGLALDASPAASEQLNTYLSTWLPRHDCPYDQNWAMAALMELDRRNETSLADAHRQAWDSWSTARSPETPLAPVREIADLVVPGR